MSSQIKYRADIDGLRAIAVLSVVAYHAFPSTIKGGFVGVDIFFVISGYLISTIIFSQLLDGSFSFKAFYIKRINRIFPALLLILIASLTAGWFALFNDEFKQLGSHVAAGAIYVSNIVLWKESGYFDNASDLKPLLHLWSLAVEEQFYIVWPFLVYFSFKRKFNLFCVIIVLTIISFLLNVASVDRDSTGTFYSLLTRFWELLIGAYLAHIKLFKNEFIEKTNETFGSVLIKIFRIPPGASKDSVLGNTKAFLGIVLICIAILSFNKSQAFPGYRALLPTMGALFLISAGPSTWLNRRILSHKILVWFGLISYPLYLWHWPILSFLHIVNTNDALTREVRFFAILISILLAWLTYLVVEKPIRLNSKNLIVTKVLFVSMILVGLIGFQIYLHSPNREDSPISSYEVEHKKLLYSGNLDFKSCPADISSSDLKNICVLSQKDQLPTIALIGDSHADRLFQGLSDFYKTINENLLEFQFSGCIPFYNVQSYGSGTEDYCLKQVNQSLNYAIATKSIKTVLLVSRGPLYFSGVGYLEGALDRNIKYIDDPENHDYPEILKAAMTVTLNKLLKAQKEVIFFIDVPELGFHPSSCLKPRMFSMTKQKAPCSISREDVDKRNAIYISSIKFVLKSFPAVKIFDQSKYLCDEKSCHAIIDGNMLYSDSNHLSYAGGRFISKKFSAELYGTKSTVAK